MRLAKYMAHAGVASRRASERLIAAGSVTVAGEVVTNPACDVDDSSVVSVNGQRIGQLKQRPVVIALNKPVGVVSTVSDTHGRKTVTDLVKGYGRIYPIGRLDRDTTGLLLLTNNGELAHRLTHPSFGVEKTYIAQISHGPVSPTNLKLLRNGIELDDGLTAPAKVTKLQQNRIKITLHEGRKRQVRRMLATVGHPVVKLERISFGPILLGSIGLGDYRELSEKEIRLLRGVSGLG